MNSRYESIPENLDKKEIASTIKSLLNPIESLVFETLDEFAHVRFGMSAAGDDLDLIEDFLVDASEDDRIALVRRVTSPFNTVKLSFRTKYKLDNLALVILPELLDEFSNRDVATALYEFMETSKLDFTREAQRLMNDMPRMPYELYPDVLTVYIEFCNAIRKGRLPKIRNKELLRFMARRVDRI